MNILVIVFAAAAILAVTGVLYSRRISRVLGEDPRNLVPSVAINDGRDFVPTRTPIVFGHHFAAIAGAGPIVGPILAMYYGWVPVLAWLLIGGLFIGAVHDYAIVHIAMREGGRSIVHIARRYLGKTAFVMMGFMIATLLGMVCASFLDLSAATLVSKTPAAELGLSHPEQWFKVVEQPVDAQAAAQMQAIRQMDVVTDAQAAVPQPMPLTQRLAIVGGVSSMSVIVITLFAPLIGYLYIKRRIPVWVASFLSVIICVVSIFVGLWMPVQLQGNVWKFAIAAYVLLASGIPVWVLIQSRDFINVHILYVGITFIVLALFSAGLQGATIQMPALNMAEASQVSDLGPMWPVLFITIACGAVSGFHALCAGGTTCKQLTNERSARQVGYFAMILETLLAVCVAGCLIVGLSKVDYQRLVYPVTLGLAGKPNAVLAFGQAVGNVSHMGLHLPTAFGIVGGMLMLEGFLLTTLDTAVRLTRYILEEIWTALLEGRQAPAAAVFPVAGNGQPVQFEETAGTGGFRTPVEPVRQSAGLLPRILKHYWFNSALAVGLMLLLSLTNSYQAIWGLFASGNQLLAALALLVASVWLLNRGREFLYTLLPGIFVLSTTLFMLLRLLVVNYVPNWRTKMTLLIADVVILVMTTGVLITVWRRVHEVVSRLAGRPAGARRELAAPVASSEVTSNTPAT